MENIKFPANVRLINQALIDFTNFEVIPSEYFNNKFFYFPEEDAFSLNFSECGIESKFFFLIMGLPLYIMMGHFALLVLYIFLRLCNVILQSPRIAKIATYLGRYLFWNGFIRLYMELYQGLCVASILNTYTADDDFNSPYYWIKACYYSRIVGMILIFALPILLFLPLYFRKRDQWNTDAFQKVYGALLDGTRVELREQENKGDWVMLLKPAIFFYRRLIFTGSVIILRKNIFTLILI